MNNKIFDGKFKNEVAGGYSLATDGNMSLNCPDVKKAIENRKLNLNHLGINPSQIICAKQRHTDKILLVTKKDCGRGALSYDNAFDSVDAFITNQKNVPICVFTADCQSVFLYDKKNHAIGIVHSGWKGTHQNITGKTVIAMKEIFKTDPQYLYAFLGPSIRKCCYEVGPEFKEYFPKFVKEKSHKLCFDNAGANKSQLMAQGVCADNISDCGLCTCCNEKMFFSYRRNPDAADRMISVLML